MSAAFGAAAVTAVGCAVVRGFDGPSVLATVGALLVSIVAVLLSRTGVNRLYGDDPAAPDRARRDGSLATARVVSAKALTDDDGTHLLVRWQVLVAAVAGPPYLTQTIATINVADMPTRATGAVVAVRVHPEQPGVVVIVDDEAPGPPPVLPSTTPVEHDGKPLPVRGWSLPGPVAGLLVLLALLAGAGATLALLRWRCLVLSQHEVGAGEEPQAQPGRPR
ncbi:DUF3592 domain-containing protein [Georgenia sp. MJ173]|uniref:DUF3592 domain-containing protein n=1 Tax=Georgenia sunbinii TaxID=3117728 RepID=UPI002F265BA8